jgi:hypothetical protein
MCQPPNRGCSQSGGFNVACTTFDGLLVMPTKSLSVQVEGRSAKSIWTNERAESVCDYRAEMAISKVWVRDESGLMRYVSRYLDTVKQPRLLAITGLLLLEVLLPSG